MGRFVNREVEFPGRIKLKKVRDDVDGIVYDCINAEGLETGTVNGRVLNSGTPLNEETLNSLEDDLVPNTRKINGKSLSADISLEYSDLGTVGIRNGGTGETSAGKALAKLIYETSESINPTDSECMVASDSTGASGHKYTLSRLKSYFQSSEASSNGKTIYIAQLKSYYGNQYRPTIHILFTSDIEYAPETMTWLQFGKLIQDSFYNFGATNVMPLSFIDGSEWCILAGCRVQGAKFYISYYKSAVDYGKSCTPDFTYQSCSLTLDSSAVSTNKEGWHVSKIQKLPII